MDVRQKIWAPLLVPENEYFFPAVAWHAAAVNEEAFPEKRKHGSADYSRRKEARGTPPSLRAGYRVRTLAEFVNCHIWDNVSFEVFFKPRRRECR